MIGLMSDRPHPLHPASVHGVGPRGRASAINPGNRFERVRLSVLGEFLDEEIAERGREGLPAEKQVPTTVFRDASRSIINRVDSPDLPFHWTINPYRGCEHGCVYCYARPTHETLGFSCGLDFETKIVAKVEAPGMLARELDALTWRGEPLMMSGVTDPYQPVERRLRITRGCLEAMAERRQPVSIVTKSRLVTRDIDLLACLARDRAASVAVSLTTLDGSLARRMEPRASSPRDRLAAISELSEAGVPVMVMTAPILPGLNDHEIPALLEAAADAGARAAGFILLRLPYQIKDVFLEWLAREFPERASRVEHGVRETRDGALNDSRWKSRFRGEGPRAEQIKRTFEVFRARHALRASLEPLSSAAFRKPSASGPTLWD